MADGTFLDSYKLRYLDLNGNYRTTIIDKHPDTCPVCGKGIEAKFVTAHGKIYDDPFRSSLLVQSVFRCPRIDCQAIFIACYYSVASRRFQSGEYVFLKNTGVISFYEEERFDDEIINLSPRFIKVFSQSKNAEDMNLDELCGFGYRKALEFLIKDFLCTIEPNEKKNIKEMSLGNLIVNKISDEDIKKLSGLAKEIGNDEAHYEKRLKKLTVEDMKKLIKLTAHRISDLLMTSRYKKIYDKLTKKPKKH